MQDARDPLFAARATDGKLIRRPLSPHISIYRWPVTMAASILNRATGIALCAGAVVLVVWLAAAAAGPLAFDPVQAFLRGPLGMFVLLGWTLSLFYHLFNGLRHLVWDMGHGFDAKKLNAVTWLVFAAAGLATLVVWVIAYTQLGG